MPKFTRDQYDEELPIDLVLAPHPDFLSQDEIRIVDHAKWYALFCKGRDAGIILVSASEIGFLSDDRPYLLADDEVLYIAASLHRWGEEGFYHA